VLLLGAVTLTAALAVSVRRRRQVAPVVLVVFYAASGMSGAGMVLSVLSWSPVLQPAGAIAAASGILVVG
jgi:predicted secreted Zn-dependent protease